MGNEKLNTEETANSDLGALRCSCGRPLIPCLNKDGKRIGVTHTSEDEDWHLEFWSTEKVMKRIESN